MTDKTLFVDLCESGGRGQRKSGQISPLILKFFNFIETKCMFIHTVIKKTKSLIDIIASTI